jgi:hypothetical protein
MGWGLDNRAHYDLLSRFPPRFEIVRADHVTLDLCSPNTPPPAPAVVIVYGRLYDVRQGYDILAVTVDGHFHQPREDRLFHITLSHAKGLSSGYSGLILKQRMAKIEKISPIHIETTPFVRLMGWRPDR